MVQDEIKVQPEPNELDETVEIEENNGKDPKIASCLMELDNAYKEIDYLTAKSNYFEALYNYTRMINDPNAGNANKAYMAYENVKRWEKIYKKFEDM